MFKSLHYKQSKLLFSITHFVLLVLQPLSSPTYSAGNCRRDRCCLLLHAADAQKLGDVELLLQNIAVKESGCKIKNG